jgi:hypothetical protein
MDYQVYKQKLEAMQSNCSIDLAEELWLNREKYVPVFHIENETGMTPKRLATSLESLRFMGFIFSIKKCEGVRVIKLLGFEDEVTEEKPKKMTFIYNISKINEVFKSE